MARATRPRASMNRPPKGPEEGSCASTLVLYKGPAVAERAALQVDGNLFGELFSGRALRSLMATYPQGPPLMW
eukprot:1046662-Lingulodinium_polyedra.AAC.1